MSTTPTEPEFPRPWSFQVELVLGCNRRCDFCGIMGLDWLPRGLYRFMEPPVAARVAATLAELNPKARVEFALRGEPLFQPQLHTMLRTFREAFPDSQLQLTTNGTQLMHHRRDGRDWLGDVLSDLNVLVVDLYPPYGKALAFSLQLEAPLQGWEVVDFYQSDRSPWHNGGNKGKTLFLMDDIAARDGEKRSRVIMNHAGNGCGGQVVKHPLKRTCTIPFREMSVHWDGTVPICCMDWQPDFIAGNLLQESAESVWRGPALMGARRILQQRNRGFAPCRRCDAPSGSRVGLLPKLSQRTSLDDEAVQGAITRARTEPPRHGYVREAEG